MRRAWHLGFVMYWWGTAYFNRRYTKYEDRMKNLDMSGYESAEDSINAMVDIGRQNIENKTYKANVGRHWGKATVTKNWKEKIKI